jgi:glycosyltransferase involved in cell wall biosynthesis
MFVVANYENGGVERVTVNLANGLTEAGALVDLLVDGADRPFLDLLSPDVRLYRFTGQTHQDRRQELQDHVHSRRPDILLPVKDKAERLAVGVDYGSLPTRLFMCMHHMPMSIIRQSSWNPFRRWQKLRSLRGLYRRADRIMAVSSAAADELAVISKLPRKSIMVVPNAVVTEGLLQEEAAPPPHPWLTDKQTPVVLGIGRFSRVKDFATLIRAFHLLRRQRPCRLILLGEGRQRKRLAGMVDALGLQGDVDLAGFDANPYPYLAHADVFVLPSRQEAFGMVLVEAMALGTPVVATDCPGAPSEILDGGRLAPLVPVGDAAAMAAAVGSVLDRPPRAAALMEAVARYSVTASARAYLEAFQY